MKTDRVTDAHDIDYTRPVLPQIDGLGERYWEWSHQHLTPRFRRQLARARSGERWPDSFPIFAQPWLEVQTHVRWQQILIFWGLVVICLALFGTRGLGSGLAAAGWWLGGLVLWSLIEYGLHRLVFHREPRSAAARRLHFLAHGIHHKDPWDQSRLVFPLFSGVMIASVLKLILLLALPLSAAMLTMSGLLTGYLAYDLGHYAWHHASTGSGWIGYLKQYHLAHHFQNTDSHYGVSQPFWDLVFGSAASRSSTMSGAGGASGDQATDAPDG